MFIIQTFFDPFYQETVNLDGRNYLFTFKYAAREDRWYFDLTDDDSQTDIVLGVKVVPNIDLLSRYRYLPNCPQGVVIAISNSTVDDSAPGLQEVSLGNRCELCYLTSQEYGSLLTTGTF